MCIYPCSTMPGARVARPALRYYVLSAYCVRRLRANFGPFVGRGGLLTASLAYRPCLEVPLEVRFGFPITFQSCYTILDGGRAGIPGSVMRVLIIEDDERLTRLIR